MFLADQTIKELVQKKIILIEPFDIKLVQPCSYDLTLEDVDLSRPITFDTPIWVLSPGEFTLASTREWIQLPSYIAAMVSGKSTWGRKGLAVHITAGHVDPGFDGQLTLEMYNHSQSDIVMKRGTPIAQLVFSYLDVEAEHPYAGRYQGQTGITQARPSLEFQNALGEKAHDNG